MGTKEARAAPKTFGQKQRDTTVHKRRGAESEATGKPQTGSNGKQREASGTEPKARPQGPILKGQARTPTASLQLALFGEK